MDELTSTLKPVLATYTPEKRRWDQTYPWIGYVLRPVSFLITLPLMRLGVTANQVTVFTGFVGLSAGGLLAWGTPAGFLWGGIFVTLLNLFDCVDGNLARLRPRSGPPAGKFYDQLVQPAYLLVYFFLGLGLARAYQDWALVLVTAGAATTILRYMVMEVRSNFRHVLGTAWQEARALGRVPSEGYSSRWYTRCYYNATEIQAHDFLLWAGALGGWLPYFLAASLIVAALDFLSTLIFYLTRAARL